MFSLISKVCKDYTLRPKYWRCTLQLTDDCKTLLYKRQGNYDVKAHAEWRVQIQKGSTTPNADLTNNNQSKQTEIDSVTNLTRKWNYIPIKLAGLLFLLFNICWVLKHVFIQTINLCMTTSSTIPVKPPSNDRMQARKNICHYCLQRHKSKMWI